MEKFVNILILASFLTLLFASSLLQRVFRKNNRRALNPYFWFSIFWVIQFSLLPLGIYDYIFEMNWETAFYIMSVHFSFWLGMAFVLVLSHPRPVAHEFRMPDFQLYSSIYKVIVPLVVIGFLWTLSRFLEGSSYSLGERILNPDAIGAARRELFAGAVQFDGSGLLFKIAYLLGFFIYVVVGAFSYFVGTGQIKIFRQKWLSIWGGIAIVLMFFGGPIVYGGRMYSFLCLFIVGMCFFLGRVNLKGEAAYTQRPPIKLKRVILLSVAAFFGFIVSVFFQSARDTSGIDVEYSLLVVHHLRSTSFWHLGSGPIWENSLVFISYFTSSSRILSFYLDVFGSVPGPFRGDYNFPNVMALSKMLFGTAEPMEFTTIRIFLFGPLEESGHFGNVWATLPRDLIADFGVVGSLLFLFFFGALSQRAYDLFRGRPSPLLATYVSLLMVIATWSCFHSLLFFGGIDLVVVTLTLYLVLPIGKLLNMVMLSIGRSQSVKPGLWKRTLVSAPSSPDIGR